MKTFDYERIPRWRFRRSVIWSLIAVAVVCSLVAFRNSGVLDIPARWSGKYWVRQCASYTVPPDRPAYEFDGAATSNPPAELSLHDSSGAQRFAAPPACLKRIVSPGDVANVATLFLGRVRTPANEEVIVVLQLRMAAVAQEPVPVRPFQATSLKAMPPATERSVVKYQVANADVRVFRMFNHTSPIWWQYFENRARLLRFYFGQRDPSDPSAFTLDFDADDTRLRMRCRLLTSGTLSVTFESADGKVPSTRN